MASQIDGYIGHIDPGNNTNYSIGSTAYGECTTAANTAAKVVDMTGFQLVKGATIHVKFTYSNTAADPTLNVNSTGAKSILLYENTAPTITAVGSWQPGAILALTYDGTAWVLNDSNGAMVTSVNGKTGDVLAGSILASNGDRWIDIYSQEEFEAYLYSFTQGRAIYNCRFQVAGTYKMKFPNSDDRLVFSAVEMHIYSMVESGTVTLDLNGCVFYSSHVNFANYYGQKNFNVSQSFILINTNSSAKDGCYFEGCTTIVDRCRVRCTLKAWGGETTCDYCYFANSNTTGAYEDLGANIQSIGGDFSLYACSFNNAATSSGTHALLGLGNGANLTLSGRIYINNVGYTNVSGTQTDFLIGSTAHAGVATIQSTATFYKMADDTAFNLSNRGNYAGADNDNLLINFIGNSTAYQSFIGVMHANLSGTLNMLNGAHIPGITDISSYNSASKLYRIPADGFVTVQNNSSSAASGIITILGAANTGSQNWVIIGGAQGKFSCFVKAGMQVFCGGTGTNFRYMKLI